MANQDLKESVLLNLRSVTQSIKGGVPFERLQRDYKDLLGAPIPFKDLGYNSLEAFIRDIPHVIALRKGSDGQLMAVGVADASTAHIVSLVSRQKTDTKKKPFRKPPPHYGMRKSLSYRAPFRESSRGSHSHYTSPPHQPVRSIPKSKLVKPPSPPVQQHSKPRPPSPPVQQHFKPRIPSEQVPTATRKYEVAPRFLKLKEMKNGVLPPEPSSFSTQEPTLSPRSTSPAFSSSPAFSFSDSVETIPPPRAVARSLPLKPQPIESSRAAQLDALESARTAKEFVEIHSRMNKIKPVYHTLLFGQKAKSKGYVSTLRLGEKSYRSYPELKPTEFEAEEEAAKRAMEDIKERKGNFRQWDELPRMVSQLPDNSNFRQRDEFPRKVPQLPDNSNFRQRDDLRGKISQFRDDNFRHRDDLRRKISQIPDNNNFRQKEELPRKVSILADNTLKIVIKC